MYHMQISITIDLGNEAMQSLNDISVALQESFRVHGERMRPLTVGEHGSLRDGNGNTVGTWAVVK